MSPKKLAAAYLRYWAQDFRLADNAPAELRTFVGSVPEAQRPMLFDALRVTANNGSAFLPDTTGLLEWYARHPDAVAQCDAILAGKNPPKNLQTVLRAGYLAVANSLQAKVRAFLAAEIEKYS